MNDSFHTLQIPPQVPPRTHSLPQSLNRINDLENLQLQDLSNPEALSLRDRNPGVDTHQVDSENAYQPLILAWCSKNTTASEYQSLTQFKQSQSAGAST